MAQQRKQLTQVEQRLSQLLELKISPRNSNGELLSDNDYLSKKKELSDEQSLIREKIDDYEQNSNDWLERCEDFFDFATKCEQKWLSEE